MTTFVSNLLLVAIGIFVIPIAVYILVKVATFANLQAKHHFNSEKQHGQNSTTEASDTTESISTKTS